MEKRQVQKKWRDKIMTEVLKQSRQQEEISCPYVGWSGGCDDCKIGLDAMACQEELSDYDNSI